MSKRRLLPYDESHAKPAKECQFLVTVTADEDWLNAEVEVQSPRDIQPGHPDYESYVAVMITHLMAMFGTQSTRMPFDQCMHRLVEGARNCRTIDPGPEGNVATGGGKVQ